MKRFSPFLLLAASVFFSSCTNTPESLGPKPPVTPAWALGHIVWEDEINTQEAATALVDGYLERDIPVSGVIIDSPWATSYNDFNWDKAITSAGGHVRFTLPAEGEWMDWRTRENYPGGTVIDREYPLDEFPLFVRKGSVMPLQEADGIQLLITPDGKHGKRTLHLPVGEGSAYRDTTVVI